MRYISKVGGCSESEYLTDRDIGMNYRALEQIDGLQPRSPVIVKLKSERKDPLFTRDQFTVRPLYENQDGFFKTEDGSVVFSDLLEKKRKGRMKVGESLEIVETRDVPNNWIEEVWKKKGVFKDLRDPY
ncbi:MAG: hypothetical protein ACLFTQ_00205 [Candidatus Aenigmatarchaeota archaeon]